MSSSSHVGFQSICDSPAISSLLMTFDPRAHQFSVTSFRPRLWDRSLSRCWFASTGEFYQQQGIGRVPAEHGTSDIEPFWDDTFRIRYGRWRIDMCVMAMLVSEEREMINWFRDFNQMIEAIHESFESRFNAWAHVKSSVDVSAGEMNQILGIFHRKQFSLQRYQKIVFELKLYSFCNNPWKSIQIYWMDFLEYINANKSV